MIAYARTLRYLYGLQYRGMKLRLRNIRILLRSAGDPHRLFPSLHIAGTNGKGSTAGYIASVAMEAGYRTALYTSPHLIRFTERIRINGVEIAERRLVEYVEQLRPAIEGVSATFFEATTCVAFRYFADEGVDLAVVETGLGGRLDATNLLVPEVSVITSIGMDHMEYLGTTIRSIAREKGGIIKKGIPVVTSASDPAALETLRSIASRRHAPFFRSTALVRDAPRRGTLPEGFRSRNVGTIRVRLGLEGKHQIENARLAVAALELLVRRKGVRPRFARIDTRAVERGLRRVARNAGLRGRLQSVGSRFLLDVAHNPDGIRTLVAALAHIRRRPGAALFGAMKDKEWETMLRVLGPAVGSIVAVAAKTPRALPARVVFRRARELGIPVVLARSVGDGIGLARKIVGRKGRILVTGSHYVVGEALAGIGGKGA